MFYTHKELCTSGVGSFTMMECLKHYLDCSTGYTELPAIMLLWWYKAEGGQTMTKFFFVPSQIILKNHTFWIWVYVYYSLKNYNIILKI